MFKLLFTNLLVSCLLLSTSVQAGSHPVQEEYDLEISSAKIREKIISRLDKDIAKAEKKDESLEESIARISADMDKNFYKDTSRLADYLSKHDNEYLKKKALKRIRKLKSKVDRGLDKLEEAERFLTDKNYDYKSFLSETISWKNYKRNKAELIEKLTETGSYVNYLKNIKLIILDKMSSVDFTSKNLRTPASEETYRYAAAVLGVLIWAGIIYAIWGTAVLIVTGYIIGGFFLVLLLGSWAMTDRA